MFEPTSYPVQLALMLLSMCAWGSWANTVKLTPGWRFQSFYWDFVVGVFAGSMIFGLVLGGGGEFLHGLTTASLFAIACALLSGIIFNAANQLLVAAIDLAGLAVAFPIGIGIALILGVVLNYVLAPAGNAVLLFLGVALVTAAIIVDALAYRKRESDSASIPKRGIIISVVSGVLMGLFYPFLTRAMSGDSPLGAYTVVPYFAIGLAICAVPMNMWMMKRPFTGEPVAFSNYTAARPAWHLWGVIGGIIWCIGLSANLISSRGQMVGPAVSYAIGQGATMISAAWGVFIWREFRGAPRSVNLLLTAMFVLFLAGLGLIALAPTWH